MAFFSGKSDPNAQPLLSKVFSVDLASGSVGTAITVELPYEDVRDIALVGNTALVTYRGDDPPPPNWPSVKRGLLVVDVGDPLAMTLESKIIAPRFVGSESGGPGEIHVSGKWAYVWGAKEAKFIAVFDISSCLRGC